MRLRRGLRTVLVAIAAALWAWNTARAAPFAYDEDVDRFGAAIAAPPGHRDGVRKAMEYCGATFKDLGWQAYSAYGLWVRRHAAFLQLSIAMRRVLATAAEKDGSGHWSRVIEVDIPKTAADLSNTLPQRVSSPASPEDRREACADTAAALHARRLDLDTVEPAIAGYLRQMSAKFRIAVPAPGEDPALGPKDARRDAQVLVGKWTTEKIRFYLSDGRFSEDDASCTLEFTGKTLTSECRVSGRLVKTVSSYEVREPGRYETTVVEDTGYPQLVGTRDVTQFRVENGKLVQSSYLPIFSADPMRPVEIEGVLAPAVLSGRRSQ